MLQPTSTAAPEDRDIALLGVGALILRRGSRDAFE